MIRSDVLKTLIPIISDQLVVSNIGLPSQELHLLDDQPTNFYMLGTMGLSSSIGLGLALAQKAKVIAIDGDGSVLTNFGTLPTIANNPADNFVISTMLGNFRFVCFCKRKCAQCGKNFSMNFGIICSCQK